MITERATEVKVYCDLCRQKGGLLTPATYDGKTRVGPWAFMCDNCFEKWGYKNGIGKATKLQKDENANE